MSTKFQNKANFNVAQASVLESKSASAPGGFLNFDFCLLIFDMTLLNEPNLLEAGSRQLEAFPPNEPNLLVSLLKIGLKKLGFGRMIARLKIR